MSYSYVKIIKYKIIQLVNIQKTYVTLIFGYYTQIDYIHHHIIYAINLLNDHNKIYYSNVSMYKYITDDLSGNC